MFAALALTALAVLAATASPAAPSCALGAYRSTQGDIVAVTPPLPDTTALRYTTLGGRRGSLGDPDAPVACEGAAVHGPGGEAWEHLQFRATPAKFRSGDLVLNGLLLEPPSSGGRKPPLVVLVHGSEKTSPIGLYYQELFTAQGVATFAYDKRGTGASQGTYTQDFKALAGDAAAAAGEARRLAAGRFSRIGFFGGSQGGWVAPLAAVEARVDFLEIGFGVVGTALEQDQWQVDYQLRQKGWGGEILPKVHEVTDATAEVMVSDFSPASLARVEALREQYGAEPWFARIEGQYSGELLKGQAKQAEWESPGVPWRYSSLEAVRRLSIPQLWVFAAEDSIAVSAPSIARLEQARGEGRRIDIAVFPRTDHGIRLFTEKNGERVYSGAMAPGYLKLIADFAKDQVRPPYGDESWPAAPPKAR